MNNTVPASAFKKKPILLCYFHFIQAVLEITEQKNPLPPTGNSRDIPK